MIRKFFYFKESKIKWLRKYLEEFRFEFHFFREASSFALCISKQFDEGDELQLNISIPYLINMWFTLTFVRGMVYSLEDKGRKGGVETSLGFRLYSWYWSFYFFYKEDYMDRKVGGYKWAFDPKNKFLGTYKVIEHVETATADLVIDLPNKIEGGRPVTLTVKFVKEKRVMRRKRWFRQTWYSVHIHLDKKVICGNERHPNAHCDTYGPGNVISRGCKVEESCLDVWSRVKADTLKYMHSAQEREIPKPPKRPEPTECAQVEVGFF